MADETFSLPPFELQPLVTNVVDLDTFNTDDQSSSQVVTCVRALEKEIYIGCRDGSLIRYILPELDGGLAESYMLLLRSTTPDATPVDDIQLVPTSSRILVLSDSKLFSFTYPNLDLISTEAPIKNSLSFCLDENPPTPSNRVGQPSLTEFCVIKSSAVVLYALREKITYRKEIPLPEEVVSPRLAKRVGNIVCLADAAHYSMIDLHASTLNPLIPISQVDDGSTVQPVIAVDGDNNFLVCSWTGTSTLGVFLNAGGDPTGRLLEYPHQVASLSIGSANVVALLANGMMQVHELSTQSLIQEIPVNAQASAPDRVLNNRVGTLVPSNQRRDKLLLTEYHIHSSEADEADLSDAVGGARPSPSRRPTFSRSRVMLQCNNSVYLLTLRSRITQVEELIDLHRLNECKTLLDKRPASVSGLPDPDEADELRFLQLRLGYRYFTATTFEDAGTWLYRGQLDPRILISHFPDLMGTLLDPQTNYEMFAGLWEHIPNSSIDDIIANYSPHLSPNTKEAPSTAELRRILRIQAREMLQEYLRKWRTKRVYEDRRHAIAELDCAVDTVFLRLLAAREHTDDLLSMLDGTHYVSWQEAEGDLIRYGQYYALDKLYERNDLDHRRIDIYSKVVEGVWTEPMFTDPLGSIFSIIEKRQDRDLMLKWQFWLYERDPTRCIELLIAKDPNPKQSSKPQDRALLAQLRDANSSGSFPFLEHLVLKKRDKDPELHTMLAEESLRKACDLLQEMGLLDLVIQSQASLKSRMQPESYIPAWISSFPPTYRILRLKCLLFLQSSPFYQAEKLLNMVESHPQSDMCSLEKALLYSRLGDHTKALASLWRELGDSAMAELYCAQGGDILHPHILEVASTLPDRDAQGLGPWLAFYQARRRKYGIGLAPGSSEQVHLVRQLLDVYLHSDTKSEGHASRLLSSQAKTLALDAVLPSIPSDWTLASFESFISQNLRSLESQKREVQIVKALSNGRNLRISDETHVRLREEGFVVEEPNSDAESPIEYNDEKEFILNEKIHPEVEDRAEDIIV